tara:strand:- start:1012 stop:1446 length:435 start_codon:yes stop_codon:yes gene_type:complete
MSFRYALSAPIQDFYVGTNYDAFGPAGLKSIAELKNQAMRSDAEVAAAIKEGEALQDLTKYRTQAELALKGPKPRSTFDRILGAANNVASIGSGLKGMGAFGSGFGATEGVNPNTIVDSFGGQASGLPGNDFYVDSSGGIFPTP